MASTRSLRLRGRIRDKGTPNGHVRTAVKALAWERPLLLHFVAAFVLLKQRMLRQYRLTVQPPHHVAMRDVAVWRPLTPAAIVADELDYLFEITISRSLVSTTNMASSFAGAVVLAFSLTLQPGFMDFDPLFPVPLFGALLVAPPPRRPSQDQTGALRSFVCIAKD